MTNQVRKPYQKQQAADWYRENKFFSLYMLRELTAVPVALESLNLFCGLANLATTAEGWANWTALQTNPLMIIFHLIVIVAALYNSKTWFDAVPKAMPIQKGEKFVAEKTLVMGSWVALVVIAVVLVALVSYFA